MMLFFETAKQAWCFLAAVPVGFLIALCLCIGKKEGMIRLLLDLLLLGSSGIVLIGMLLFFREGFLRLYHLLGMILGAFLYLNGICQVKRKISRSIKEKRQQKEKQKEGIEPHKNEMVNTYEQKG